MFCLCLISTAEVGLFESQNIFIGFSWVCSFCLYEDVCLLSGFHSMDMFCFPKQDAWCYSFALKLSAALCVHAEVVFEGWAGVSQGESEQPDALQNRDVGIRKTQWRDGWGWAKHVDQLPELSVTRSVSSSSTSMLLGYLSTEQKRSCSWGEREFNINTVSRGKAREWVRAE